MKILSLLILATVAHFSFAGEVLEVTTTGGTKAEVAVEEIQRAFEASQRARAMVWDQFFSNPEGTITVYKPAVLIYHTGNNGYKILAGTQGAQGACLRLGYKSLVSKQEVKQESDANVVTLNAKGEVANIEHVANVDVLSLVTCSK